ncbi:S-adenosyl-L-methionine-dependent methyltransferase [Xylaria arbuscula]|nr:S-adenosyl-L-methionine-dependent methyltransferase [Xylaria arbuscula]
MAAGSLEKLGNIISRNATTLARLLEARNVPSPTIYDIDVPDLKDIDGAAVAELVDATRELQALVQSPAQQLNLLAFANFDTVSIGILLEFNIPSLVPLTGSIPLSSLATKSGLPEDKLARVIRYATTNFFFTEPQPNIIAHTALSAALARDSGFATYLRLCLVDLAPITVALPSALRRWPDSDSVTQCAVNAAFETDQSFFAWLSADPVRRERFDGGMAGFSGGNGDGIAAGRSSKADLAAFPWGDVLPPDAVVVDVGGGSGHVAKALAGMFPAFEIIVQDRAEVVEAATHQDDDNTSSPNLSLGPSNVTFQTHSFFNPQPLHGADAYFLRQVLHDWPDAEVLRILRALLPALKPGSRVLVSEYVVPSPTELSQTRGDGDSEVRMLDAKRVRQMDLQMMAVLNAKERTKEELVRLLELADPRLRVCAVHEATSDRQVCVFEAKWEP